MFWETTNSRAVRFRGFNVVGGDNPIKYLIPPLAAWTWPISSFAPVAASEGPVV